MRHFILVISALAFVASAPASAAADKRTVAIYPLQPLGTDPAIVERLEELVYQEVGATGRVVLVTRDEVMKVVVQDRQRGVICQGTPDCLATLGLRVGAELVFYGTVATLGGTYVLDAKLVESGHRRIVSRRSSALQGEQAVLIQGVRDLAVQLVAPDLWAGTLELRLQQTGAEVFVDGLAVGKSPIAPLNRVVPGKHVLRIVSADFPDFERFVDVHFGATTVLEIDLAKREAIASTMASSAPASQLAESQPAAAKPVGIGSVLWPVAISATAVGAVVLAGGLVSALQLLVPWFDATQQTTQLKSGTTVVTDRDAYGAAARQYRGALGLWWLGEGLSATGSALIAAGGGLMIYLLTQPAVTEVADE